MVTESILKYFKPASAAAPKRASTRASKTEQEPARKTSSTCIVESQSGDAKPTVKAKASRKRSREVAPFGKSTSKQVQVEYESQEETEEKQDSDSASVASAAADNRDAEHKLGDAGHGENEISEYEQKRRAKMAENALFLQQLGMAKVQNEILRTVQVNPARGSGGASKPKKTIKKMEQPLPARRSRRLRGGAAEESVAGGGQLSSAVNDEVDAADEELPVDSFDDSSVLRYICASKSKETGDSLGGGGVTSDEPSEKTLVGFSLDASVPVMTDAHLKKIYSLSFSPFRENGLIAAGGHQGYVSIYPMDPEPVDDSPPPQQQQPLMSFKAHSGWVSCVNLTKSVQGEKNILLTASNDSFVKVWDLNQSSSLLKSAREVLKTNSLHRNGIFGMDTHKDSLLTCSKDASIVLSKFRDSGSALETVHRFHEHDGVVKSVCFSSVNPDQFASGGNDRALRVFDVRFPNTAVLEIRNAHSRAINSVQWHPTNSNWILSASFDPDLHLFDMRNPSLPLFTFHGHYLDNQQNAIYHPVFVDQGSAIVAAGGSRCQEVSLYKTADGSTISRGFIGMKADYIAADPFRERLLIASGGRLEFADFRRETHS